MPPENRKPVTRKPVTRKPAVHKKKSKPFPTQWKVVIAGLLLILLSPFYYGYILN
ncbi:MAG: glycoside hydrolase family 25 protein, partial [Pedobacter sp.]